MFKTAFAVGCLLAGTSTMAQTTQPAGPTETTVPTPPASDQAPAPGTGTTPAPMDQQPTTTTAPASAETQPTTTPAPADTTGDPVLATVEADWSKYDTNSNDGLNRAEFDKWLTDLQTAAGKKAPTRSYLSAAFQKADTDKSKSVSKEELATFLKG